MKVRCSTISRPRQWILTALTALVALAGLFSLCLYAQERSLVKDSPLDPPASEKSPNYYKEGVKAFRSGDDERAAQVLVKAARLDWRVGAVLSDPRWKGSLPKEDLGKLSGLDKSPPSVDTASRVLYRLGIIRRNQAQQSGQSLSVTEKARVKRSGVYYFEKVVNEYGNSPETDDAALELIKAGLCVRESGFPACTAWSIKSHEGWLKEYGYSPLREKVIKRLAGLYLELADKLEEDAPWNSSAKAELCRGKALELASVLDRPGSGRRLRDWAGKFTKRIKTSGKAYSLMPSELLR